MPSLKRRPYRLNCLSCSHGIITKQCHCTAERFAERSPFFISLSTPSFNAENSHKGTGQHHEIYLGDPHKGSPDKLKTVIREPIVKNEKLVSNEMTALFYDGFGPDEISASSSASKLRDCLI